jgi:nucleolar protein 14
MEEGRPVGKVARQKAALAKVIAQTQEGSTGINPQMPYILECPTTMEQFVDMVKEYAQGPQDVAEMITRIRQYHAIRSGGDRAKVHNFYDILMRRLACLGDALAPARVVEVDAISEALAAMTPEMAAVAAALWGRMLRGLQAKLGKALRDHELGQRARSTWPSPGALLLLRLLPRIFPATDFRHPVVTPALLYIGQALSQCPILTPTDVERGLFVAALAVQYTEGAGRLMPEVFAFVLSLLGAMAGTDHALGLPTLAPSLAAVLHQHTVKGTGATAEEGGEDKAIAPIVLGRGKHLEEEEEEDEDEEKKGDRTEAVTAALARQYLSASCRLLRRLAAGPINQSPAARELFEPFLTCLAALESIVAHATKKTGMKGKSPAFALLRETKARVEGVVEEALKARKVLSWRKKGVTAIQSLAPRVIDNFVVRKDEGMEREAARVKQLTRQVKREKKGVMRELRRDAAFLDAEKVRVEREKEETRKQVVKDNTAWFEASAADFNKQVKMAKGETLRGGGSGLKRDMLGKGKKR